jgi:predicted AlkP superfamily pyrophosphatase or phosphodiesterase
MLPQTPGGAKNGMLLYGRMTASRLIALAFSPFVLLAPAASRAETAVKPKLVVVVVVDQFRYDYLTRFRQDYHGGLDRLLREGADFTNGFYAQAPTVTAVGHSIMLSGAMPAVSGIVSNAWYDRTERKVVTSVCDWTVHVVGAPQPKQGDKCTDSDPASPNRLLVTTLGDELKDAHPNAKVVGISIKARGAILPSGHSADGAFWFDDATGNFVTSSFYMEKLPEWADTFNSQKLPAKYVDQKWDGFPKWDFHSVANPYAKLPASPWGNELIERFAEAAIAGEKLGQRGVTDLLTVSFSSNDYVGHAVGPNAPEVRDMAIRTDQLLGKLFSLIDRGVGMKNTVVVLSADHGVAATPEHDEAMRIPGGYIDADIEDVVQKALTRRFGAGEWLIPGAGETSLYVNWDTVRKAHKASGGDLEEEDIYRIASDALLTTPQLHVARVYTMEQLENGVAGDFIAQALMNGFNPKRSGDLSIVLEPGFMPGRRGTTHFSPWAYDRHVPMLLMGPGIKAGHYDENVQVNDIAPTLATMLDVQTPSGSSGQVLPALTH